MKFMRSANCDRLDKNSGGLLTQPPSGYLRLLWFVVLGRPDPTSTLQLGEDRPVPCDYVPWASVGIDSKGGSD
jgi:hypothetical protein